MNSGIIVEKLKALAFDAKEKNNLEEFKAIEYAIRAVARGKNTTLSGGDEGLRICICCSNIECMYYWECMCTKEWSKNESFWLDEKGKCKSFVEGKCEWYEHEDQE